MKIVKKLHNTVAVDAMTRFKHLVQELGKPSLFITYTLDLTCKEVKDNLAPGQSPYDRPELLNEVFEIKKKELIREIVVVDGIFGVWVEKFQKRGAPQCHMLLWIKSRIPCNFPTSFTTNTRINDRCFALMRRVAEERRRHVHLALGSNQGLSIVKYVFKYIRKESTYKERRGKKETCELGTWRQSPSHCVRRGVSRS